MPLKALIWDVDGTMTDNEELHRMAFNEAFADAGLAWRWTRPVYADLLRTTGGKERIAAYIRATNPEYGTNADLDSMIKVLHARKTIFYNQFLAEGRAEPRPGVRRLIREAKGRGLALAIATTTSRINVLTLLERCFPESEGSWAVLVCGEDVRRKKPDSEVYLLALDRLGLAPGRCLALEDSENGVRAAVAAGIPTLAVPSSYTLQEGFDGAVGVIDHLGEADRPCNRIQGPRWLANMVTVDVLERLRQRPS
jgi:HAD superfamily hydrolase (TIGR01509 family)